MTGTGHDLLIIETAQTLRSLIFVLKDTAPPDERNDLVDMLARLDRALAASTTLVHAVPPPQRG